jgi:hypothetical protein
LVTFWSPRPVGNIGFLGFLLRGAVHNLSVRLKIARGQLRDDPALAKCRD